MCRPLFYFCDENVLCFVAPFAIYTSLFALTPPLSLFLRSLIKLANLTRGSTEPKWSEIQLRFTLKWRRRCSDHHSLITWREARRSWNSRSVSRRSPPKIQTTVSFGRTEVSQKRTAFSATFAPVTSASLSKTGLVTFHRSTCYFRVSPARVHFYATCQHLMTWQPLTIYDWIFMSSWIEKERCLIMFCLTN